MRFDMTKDFREIPAETIAPGETEVFPVFSEANLYSRVGKDDARFILGIADEYAALTKMLGQENVEKLLALARSVERAECDMECTRRWRFKVKVVWDVDLSEAIDHFESINKPK